MNKKIIFSLSVIGIVAAIAIGGTVAYFSDTETSVGNRFVAGKLNLKIDSECHYNGKECIIVEPGYYVWEGTNEECYCTWEETDLTNELFFNLDDVKPGDWGEDTISLRIENNDAWVCAQIANLQNFDNGCEHPELIAETAKYGAGSETCSEPGKDEGELQDYLLLTLWRDDNCNNILDSGEEIFSENQAITNYIWPLADSTTNSGPFIGNEKYCIGAAWNVPLATGNIIQSDSVTADLRFVAVQARHMDDFKCAELFTEVCDGIDNDFDGQIDEGWDNLGQSCIVGVGACQVEGTYMCDISNPAGPAVCSAVAGTGTTEICDGIDNNCDGQIDEGNPGGGASCDTGLQGVCSVGTIQCQSGQLNCIQSTQSSNEVCDGIDNDCDGQVDEGDVCWISPTSNNNTAWIDEEKGRDRNLSTYAIYSVPADGSSPTLSYYFSTPIQSNKIRHKLTGMYGTNVIITATIDGIPKNVYSGIGWHTWLESAISPAGVVSQIDITATNTYEYSSNVFIYEIQVWKSF